MLTKFRALTKKQVSLAVAALSIFGVVGAVSVTQAAPVDKPTKEQCAAAGYTNYGQCVKLWAQGHGYSASGQETIIESDYREHKVQRSWVSNWRFW